MTDYSMEVIPKPKEGIASVISWSGEKGNFAVIKGEGNDNYICGTCGNNICQNVVRGQIINFVIVCPNCGSYNILKGT